MGYPVEKIDRETTLYVYIGPNVIEENRQESFNRHFKDADINATLMPLNIREDDLGFFIHNFKNSKIRGAVFAQEFWPLVATLLQSTGTVTSEETLIDSLIIDEGSYLADFVFPEAVFQCIINKRNIEGAQVAIIGASDMTEKLVGALVTHQPAIIRLYDETVENLMACEQQSHDIPTDINRIQGEDVDVNGCDIVIDTSGRYHILSDEMACCVTLTAQKHNINRNNTYTLTYDDIFDTIAEIKTREWIDNGRI